MSQEGAMWPSSPHLKQYHGRGFLLVSFGSGEGDGFPSAGALGLAFCFLLGLGDGWFELRDAFKEATWACRLAICFSSFRGSEG